MNYRINLKSIKGFGLSLDTRKRYVMHCDNHTWSILGIYDNLEEAVNKGLHQTLDEYYEDLKKYGKEKGFVTDLNLWDVINGIRRNVVGNEVTGHIRRNAVPCLRSEQGDVIKYRRIREI